MTASYLEERFGLRGRVALVTGSSQGIGLAMARALARAGADVIVNGRDPAKLAPVARELSSLGVACAALAADLGRRDRGRTAVSEAIRWKGRLDILVNNAGIIRRAPAAESTDADWDAVMRVNLDGVFTACRAAGRHMLERGSAGSSTSPRSCRSSGASRSPRTRRARGP